MLKSPAVGEPLHPAEEMSFCQSRCMDNVTGLDCSGAGSSDDSEKLAALIEPPAQMSALAAKGAHPSTAGREMPARSPILNREPQWSGTTPLPRPFIVYLRTNMASRVLQIGFHPSEHVVDTRHCASSRMRKFIQRGR
jgi:hypothetical protein